MTHTTSGAGSASPSGASEFGEKFEGNKMIISSRKSKKGRKYNDQKENSYDPQTQHRK
jgi:hypothetical protein